MARHFELHSHIISTQRIIYNDTNKWTLRRAIFKRLLIPISLHLFVYLFFFHTFLNMKERLLIYFFLFLLLFFVDVQRQGSTNDDFSGRNGHLPSKSYNQDRSGYNGQKWYNEKRGNNRRSDDPRSKSDFNYREQSGGRGGNSSNKQRAERDVVSADRESNSSVENNNSRRRPKAKNTHNQTNSGTSSNIFFLAFRENF